MTIDDAALGTAQDTDGPKRYTDGTHRICSPEETLARLRPVTAQMGITRVANDLTFDHVVPRSHHQAGEARDLRGDAPRAPRRGPGPASPCERR